MDHAEVKERVTTSAQSGALYRYFADRIGAAIARGRLEPGLVLLEGPLANALATSRATIRKALARLNDAGEIRRFDGRGYVVPAPRLGAEPIRRAIDENDLRVEEGTPPEKSPAADRIIDEVGAALRMAVAFGHYRVLEQPLADSFGVSRAVVREVLWRLRDRGIVEKGHHSPWLAGPLTARAVAEDYEIRILIEPHALKSSAPFLASREIRAMRERLDAVLVTPGRVDSETVGKVEEDLHLHCLEHYANQRAWTVLLHGQLPLLVNRLFARFIGIESDDPTFVEHEVVLERLAEGAFDAAAAAHTAHLKLASRRTMERLRVLSVIQEPELPDYLERIV